MCKSCKSRLKSKSSFDTDSHRFTRLYPTATVTRFAHSIGALGTMIRILDAAGRNGVKFEREQEENLRLAALLHDVGHYPYSHLMEKVDWVELTEDRVEKPTHEINAAHSKYPPHEEVGRLIVTGQPDLLIAIGDEERAKAIADIFTRSGAADPQLSKLIHSGFDIDRCDYLLRDSYATGVPYGQIDINYLLNNLKVSQDKVVGFKDKALAALEHFLLARFFMHRVVYYHKTIFGLEESCRQLLKRLRDRNDRKYAVPPDGEAAADENEVIRALALSIQNRTPPALLKEVPVCEEAESQYHAGKAFLQSCRTKLPALVREFGIPLGQFLLCEPRVEVVKRPREETCGQMAKLSQDDLTPNYVPHAIRE